MLKEFYDFIAKRINRYFLELSSEGFLQKGESFCLKLDDAETVQAVADALKDLAIKENNCGVYEYNCMDGSIYRTFTLQVVDDEIIIAAQVDGMTNDFLCATLRNAANDEGKPYQIPFNPLALIKSKVFKPLLPVHIANAFKDTISKVYGLGPKQQDTLFQCIIETYNMCGILAENPNSWEHEAPTFEQVYQRYSNNEDIKKNDSLAAAMNKLQQFHIFEAVPRKTKSLFEILKGVVVIDLSGYDTDIQNLIVAITLDLFYAQMQAVGSSKLDGKYRQLTKLILVDEADNFMSEGFPSLKKILKEGREFGVGTILSTQFLKHFGSGDDDYAKYILTWIVHNVADLKLNDVEFVFKTESKSMESQRLFNDIKKLQKHYSIVKIGSESPQYIRDRAFWELYNEFKSN